MLKCQQLKSWGLVCEDESVLPIIEADFLCNFDRVHNGEPSGRILVLHSLRALAIGN